MEKNYAIVMKVNSHLALFAIDGSLKPNRST